MRDRVTNLGELPGAIEPRRDLWPDIAARLDVGQARQAPPAPRPARPRLPLWLAGAAVASLLVLGVALDRQMRDVAGRENNELASLPPEAQAGITHALEAIHAARVELEEALAQDGGNADLQAMLVSTYYEESRVTGYLNQPIE